MHVPRASACVACLLLSLVSCEIAEDSAAKADLEDLDLGSLDTDDDDDEDQEDDIVGESPELVDFDKDMPEAERFMRMNVCLAGASARVQANAEAVSDLAARLVDEKPGMSKENAINSVFFTWMMTCYMNIADEDAKEAGEGNAEVLKDARLYERPSENAQPASRRQWDFLMKVVQDHVAKVDAAQKAEERKSRSEPRRTGTAGQPPEQEPPLPSSGSKASILLLGAVFGIIGTVTMFLMRKEKEERDEKERKKSKKEKKKNH